MSQSTKRLSDTEENFVDFALPQNACACDPDSSNDSASDVDDHFIVVAWRLQRFGGIGHRCTCVDVAVNRTTESNALRGN